MSINQLNCFQNSININTLKKNSNFRINKKILNKKILNKIIFFKKLNLITTKINKNYIRINLKFYENNTLIKKI